MLRSLRVVIFAALALTLTLAAELTQAVAESYLVDAENQMTDLVNLHRSSHGLPALAVNEGLRMMARRQTQRMVLAGYIFHNPNLAQDADQAVPGWTLVGENVGVGPGVEAVQNAFLNSPKHHENIDRPEFTAIGVGAMAGEGGAMFFTQNFAAFAAPRRTAAPTAAPRPPRRTSAPRQRSRAAGVQARAAAPPSSPAPTPLPTLTPSPAPTATPAAPSEVAGHKEVSVSLWQGLFALFGRLLAKLLFWTA